jgi:hypothetical protein
LRTANPLSSILAAVLLGILAAYLREVFTRLTSMTNSQVKERGASVK